MAKKKNILLTHGSLHVPLNQMMSIDIEGAPTLVKQVSIYDFNHELLYNKTATSGKELPQWEITKIQQILNQARVLVGHSLDSDLLALRRRGVYLYNDTRCLDTYFTMIELKQEGLLDGRYSGATLKETALYFHIRANDYHTSHTDALAAAVVLQEMMKLGDGMVVEIAPSIIQIPRPPFGMEPDWTKEERGDMSQNKTIGPKADSRVYKVGDFYECVIAGGQGPTFVRMTREEYDLFLRIRELRPDYTVRLYSETILTPSIVARVAALEEAEKAAEAAPVAMELAEEPSEAEAACEEIEESPVSAEEEIVEVPAAEISGEMSDADEVNPAEAEEIEEAAAPDREETAPAEAAQEESAPAEAAAVEEIEEAPSEEISLEIEPEALTEENAEISEEAENTPPVESDEMEESSAVETAEVSEEDADTRDELISCEEDEAALPEDIPPLPEEMPEGMDDALAGGASEPLFGEGIWNLPEDFPADFPVEEAEKQTPTKAPTEEEDAYSMSLFFEDVKA